MNITVSNIERVFLTNSDLKERTKLFIDALTANDIPYEMHNNGEIEVLFFSSPLIEDADERLEIVLKQYVRGFSKVIWKTSPLNCKVSNTKEIFIRDLKNSLTIPVKQFKAVLEKLSLHCSYGSDVIALRFKKPSRARNLDQYILDFENTLRYVKTIADINWK